MIKLLAAIFFAAAFSASAETQPRGSDRLRELVVFPEMNLNFQWGLYSQGTQWVIEVEDVPTQINDLKESLKKQPRDGSQLLRLGVLLDRNGETNEAKVVYQKAELFCRNKAVTNPQDGLNLTDLGQTLWQLDKNDEAECIYRRATLVSSNDWRCWTRLGKFLADYSSYLLIPEGMERRFFPLGQKPAQDVLDYRPSPDTLIKSESFFAEASRCYDRAIALAQREPEVFVQRAAFLSESNYQSCFIKHFRDNKTIDSTSWLMACFSKESITNLKEAADLSPQNYQYISLAAYFEWCSAIIQATRSNSDLDDLPDATRQFIKDAMTRLEMISESPDKKIAAGALENLGILNMVFRNMSAATANFRQAVALDPTRETSWDMLLGSLVDSASPDELTAICESRLKYKDSAHNHLLLAKTLARQKKWDKATEQAEIARQQEPNNIVPPLMLAAIALKQSELTNYLSIARANLIRTGVIIENMDKSDEKDKRSRELLLDLTILHALDGEPEDARHLMERFLKRRPNDGTAKEILQAVN